MNETRGHRPDLLNLSRDARAVLTAPAPKKESAFKQMQITWAKSVAQSAAPTEKEEPLTSLSGGVGEEIKVVKNEHD